jgi:hypothetical protein
MADKPEIKPDIAPAPSAPNPKTPTFTIVRPCVAGDRTFNAGDEQALLNVKLPPGVIKTFILAGAIAGQYPGITITEADRTELFVPPVTAVNG